jgi:hypothetical protein
MEHEIRDRGLEDGSDADMEVRRRTLWLAVGISTAAIVGMWLWLMPATVRSLMAPIVPNAADQELGQKFDEFKDGLSGIAQEARAIISPKDGTSDATSAAAAASVERLKGRIQEESQKN